jgi:Thoeris protein ThsB, TIR-like domain
MSATAKSRVFVSFDYDYDLPLKNLLVGQSRHVDSPFFIEDWSIKEATKAWKIDARRRIRRSDVVIVICGRQTHHAVGVTAEIEIAKDEEKRYCLLRGYSEGMVRRPKGTSWFFDDIHPWTWKELQTITKIKDQSWWTKLW